MCACEAPLSSVDIRDDIRTNCAVIWSQFVDRPGASVINPQICSRHPPDSNLQRLNKPSNLDLAMSGYAGIKRIADVKPKRPLSAYNFFFKSERAEILRQLPEVGAECKPRRSHGKIGFKDLALRISTKWKSLPAEERSHFEAMAVEDKKRYQDEKREWKKALEGGSTSRNQTRLTPDPFRHAEEDELDLSSIIQKDIVLRRFSLLGGFHLGGGVHDQLEFVNLPFDSLPGPIAASQVDIRSLMMQRMSLGPMSLDIEPDDSSSDLQTKFRSATSDADAHSLFTGSAREDIFAPTEIADFVPCSLQEFFSANLDQECKALLINMFRKGSG
jgi:HMG-box domain